LLEIGFDAALPATPWLLSQTKWVLDPPPSQSRFIPSGTYTNHVTSKAERGLWKSERWLYDWAWRLL